MASKSISAAKAQREGAPPERTAVAKPKGKPLPAHRVINRTGTMGLMAIKAAAGALFGEIDNDEMLADLVRQIDQVKAGNLAPVEAMLLSQAKALEVLSTRLLYRGMSAEHIAPFQANVALALKAQAQCRATLQTLIEAKQPRAVAFVRQANIAQQQQVNNGTLPSHAHAHARETQQPANELLEEPTHEQEQRMVPGAQAAPARGDSTLAAVGALHRSQDAPGKGSSGGQ